MADTWQWPSATAQAVHWLGPMWWTFWALMLKATFSSYLKRKPARDGLWEVSYHLQVRNGYDCTTHCRVPGETIPHTTNCQYHRVWWISGLLSLSLGSHLLSEGPEAFAGCALLQCKAGIAQGTRSPGSSAPQDNDVFVASGNPCVRGHVGSPGVCGRLKAWLNSVRL